MQVYDATMLLARAMQAVINDTGDVYDGHEIYKHVVNQTFLSKQNRISRHVWLFLP